MIIHQGIEETTEQVEQGVSKRCIVISGRAHPGESNDSHMVKGFIDLLCGQSKEAYMMRKHGVFQIVSMLNPDGVALDNYKTGLSGRDFNRKYKNSDKAVFPEVYSFKKLIKNDKSQGTGNKSRPSSRKTTEDNTQEPRTRQFAEDNVFSQQGQGQLSDVFRQRRAINIIKPINQSKERILSVEERKDNTAKIINFSFCSQTPTSRSKDEKLKLYIPPRLNFVEIVTNKWSDERSNRR